MAYLLNVAVIEEKFIIDFEFIDGLDPGRMYRSMLYYAVQVHDDRIGDGQVLRVG